MTLNELYAEIADLGFETSVENSNLLLSATQRALSQIFTERPLIKTKEIYVKPPVVREKIDTLHHQGYESHTLKTTAKAFSFKTSGIGKCTVTDATGEREILFSGSSELHRGFLVGESTLRFSGEYSFTVYDILLLDEIRSDSVSDIPDSPDSMVFNMADYVDDFLSFISLPEDSEGKPIKGSEVLGKSFRLPVDFCGKVKLCYKSCPQKITSEYDGELILPDGCEHLLALLSASYVWLDDAPEKAQYYLSLYRDGITAVKIYSRQAIETSYNDVIGWG